MDSLQRDITYLSKENIRIIAKTKSKEVLEQTIEFTQLGKDY